MWPEIRLYFEKFQSNGLKIQRIRKAFFILLLYHILFAQSINGGMKSAIQREEVTVLFEESLRDAGQEVADIYEGLKKELEDIFGWGLDFGITVLLIKDGDEFQKIASNDLIVAFAVPQKNLVVMNYSKMNTYPFTLGTTLKHELCHLLLHHHIRRAHLPKWLDEGVSQWASDGIAEIIMNREQSPLEGSILSGNYIAIKDLAASFPDDRASLLLAYEESKSMVDYINREFGRKGILKILQELKDGHEVDLAIMRSLSISLFDLEKKWQRGLQKNLTWFTYLAVHLYEILFFFTALIAIYGFVRLLHKKRDYKDEEDDFY